MKRHSAVRAPEYYIGGGEGGGGGGFRLPGDGEMAASGVRDLGYPLPHPFSPTRGSLWRRTSVT